MSDVTGEGRGRVPGVVWGALVGGTAAAVLAVLGITGGGLSLPAVFIALAAVMLMLALAALWQSLRGVFGGGPEAYAVTGGGLPERAALLEEKQTLLRAIKDIAFEREVGKISDEDFTRLDRAYRKRAKEVLRRLDQDLDPFLEKAERLVALELGEEDDGPYRRGQTKRKKRRGKKGAGKRKKKPLTQECPSCGTANDLDAEHCKECGARLAPVECPNCGTENDPDAKFCKSCATSLQGDGGERRVGAGAGGSTKAKSGASDEEASASSRTESADAGGSSSGSDEAADSSSGSPAADAGSDDDADSDEAGADADSDGEGTDDVDADSGSDEGESDESDEADSDSDSDDEGAER